MKSLLNTVWRIIAACCRMLAFVFLTACAMLAGVLLIILYFAVAFIWPEEPSPWNS